MTTLTATAARTRWFGMLKTVKQSHKVYAITSKDGDAVLLSKEDYEGLLETLELLSIPGMAKSIQRADREIKQGKTYSMKEVFGD
ncbi:MAG: type II toxin-antitoxin system prevent-host-death family antitoxin [Candidatus Omnitrophica bacterium]|nr:type II toxin-antitoxin system prevent-host-death family antitoxin [Candidatus Omnitrophota bacterium]